MGPDLIDEVRDLAPRPHRRDVRRLGRVDERDIRPDVLDLLAVAGRRELHGSGRRRVEPPGDDDLPAVVEIAKGRRELLGEADRRQRERQVRQYRPADHREEVAEDQFQVLTRAHVGGAAAVLVGQPIEQDRVHVVAETEGEDPGVGGPKHVEDLVRRPVALAVGEKDHDERAAPGRLTVRPQPDRVRQGVAAIGAAGGVEPGREVLGGGAVGPRRGREVAEENVETRREPDHVEAVLLGQLVDAELQRSPGLNDLVAGHGAAGVDDEDDVLRLVLGLGPQLPRRQHEDEVPRLIEAGLIGDHREAQVGRIGVVQEHEVFLEAAARRFVGNPG